jgi:hypothetical protein
MRNLFLIVAAAIAVSPMMASAASTSLIVTGAITPTSCVPTFAGGTTVQLGNLSANDLNIAAQTNFPEKDITLSIACTAPAAVEFAVTDGRGDTKAPGLIFSPTGFTGENLYYGLGTVDGVAIGGFGLRVGIPSADERAQQFLVRTPNNLNWRIPQSLMVSNAPVSYSWGEDEVKGPIAARFHAFPMKVAAAVRPARDLPVTTDEYKVDGFVTFDVYYL